MKDNFDINAFLALKAAEAAAMQAFNFIGKYNKEEADGAAVEAMRKEFLNIAISGTIIIGEGEKDKAPMLYRGEKVGSGGDAIDIAVDPIDGTTLTAHGKPGAVSVLSGGESGSFLDLSKYFYMEKLIAPRDAKGAVSLNMSPGENVIALSKALKKDIKDIKVIILDRPRHKKAIEEIVSFGAGIKLISDGDVMGALEVGLKKADMLYGIGGSPEGVIAAAALKSFGCIVQGRVIDNSISPEEFLENPSGDILTSSDLAKSDKTFFIATGITDGLVKGVKKCHNKTIVSSMVITPKNLYNIKNVYR